MSHEGSSREGDEENGAIGNDAPANDAAAEGGQHQGGERVELGEQAARSANPDSAAADSGAPEVPPLSEADRRRQTLDRLVQKYRASAQRQHGTDGAAGEDAAVDTSADANASATVDTNAGVDANTVVDAKPAPDADVDADDGIAPLAQHEPSVGAIEAADVSQAEPDAARPIPESGAAHAWPEQQAAPIARDHADGRPPRRSGRRRRSVLVVAVLVILLVASAVAGGLLWGSSALRAGAPAPTCRSTVIRIVADPVIEPAVSAAVKASIARNSCVTTTVTSRPSAEVASRVAAGAGVGADIWIPDSEVWQDRVATSARALGRPAPAVRFSRPVATSPLIFAARSRDADVLSERGLGWRDVAAGSIPATVVEPSISGIGLSSIAVLDAHQTASDATRRGAMLIALGRTVASSVTTAFDAIDAASVPQVVLTTEQAVVARNGRGGGDHFAIYPSDGTSHIAFPFVETMERPDRARQVRKVETAIRTVPTVFTARGFRAGSADLKIRASGVLPVSPQTAEPPSGASQVALLHTWTVATMRSRLLALADVSSSMVLPARSVPGDVTSRLQVFQRATGAAIGRLSAQSEVGIWAYSSKRAGDQAWQSLVPIGPVSDPAQAAALRGAIDGLAPLVHGDTDITDSVLAAFTEVQNSYAAGRLNSVVLFTDGKTDAPGSMSLDTLLSQLRAKQDPARPVPIILIGFGPDADLAPLKQIAAVTGGDAYIAADPTELGAVIQEALSQRACRPSCGQ